MRARKAVEVQEEPDVSTGSDSSRSPSPVTHAVSIINKQSKGKKKVTSKPKSSIKARKSILKKSSKKTKRRTKKKRYYRRRR